jgi:ferritin-like protein
MTQYHEPVEKLEPQDRNYVRALNSLKEEIEAINWYQQRVAACEDEQLKAVLAHNRDEEIEHASMVLEWLRRNMPAWDEALRTYIFSEGDITELEEAATGGGAAEEGGQTDGLGIGSLRG